MVESTGCEQVRPEVWIFDDVNPDDSQSWKRFGTSGPGFEFLYRLYDDRRRLLYVGITWNPFVRWRRHKKAKSWWREVAFVELWRSPDEYARHWETRCIKEQSPIYNIHQAVRT